MNNLQRKLKDEERIRTAVANGETAEQSSRDGAEEDLPIKVRDTATGKVLRGEDAPRPHEVDAWLEANPG